jgi:hypothetical protein
MDGLERPKAEALGYLEARTGNSKGNSEILRFFASLRMTSDF